VNFPRAVLTPMMPMTMASLAPLLSQTSMRDSFWIMTGAGRL